MFWHFSHQIHFISVFFRNVLVFPLGILHCIYIAVLLSEEYSEPCQTSKMDFFVKIVNGLKPLFLQKTLFTIFDRVLNTPLDGWIL